jgi:hypothetical protein
LPNRRKFAQSGHPGCVQRAFDGAIKLYDPKLTCGSMVGKNLQSIGKTLLASFRGLPVFYFILYILFLFFIIYIFFIKLNQINTKTEMKSTLSFMFWVENFLPRNKHSYPGKNFISRHKTCEIWTPYLHLPFYFLKWLYVCICKNVIPMFVGT